MPEKNYYKILQIDPSAEPEVVQAAYRRLAQKYHPDANGSSDATRRMQELNEAYDVLCDPVKRAAFDRQHTDQAQQPAEGNRWSGNGRQQWASEQQRAQEARRSAEEQRQAVYERYQAAQAAEQQRAQEVAKRSAEDRRQAECERQQKAQAAEQQRKQEAAQRSAEDQRQAEYERQQKAQAAEQKRAQEVAQRSAEDQRQAEYERQQQVQAAEKQRKQVAAQRSTEDQRQAEHERQQKAHAAEQQRKQEAAEQRSRGSLRHLLLQLFKKDTEGSAERRFRGNLRLTLAPGVTMEFVRVPAGQFSMGSKAANKLAYADEKPQHTVKIPSDYWIGKYPVTNEQFARFVAASRYKFDQDRWETKADHPMDNVSWQDAMAYCQWLNDTLRGELKDLTLRLPTEAEWEKAARGTQGNEWPWGNEFDQTKCNLSEGSQFGTTPVGVYSPQGDSPYGAADMAGNVWEWCHSLYRPYPYQATDGRESESGNDSRVVRGGSWRYSPLSARCACRRDYQPDNRRVGFRCCCSSPGSNF